MSLDSLGVVNGSVNDSISLLNHCESSLSTLDSLAESADSLCYENGTTPRKSSDGAYSFGKKNVQGDASNSTTSEPCQNDLNFCKDKENNSIGIPSDSSDLLESVPNSMDTKGDKRSSTVKSKIPNSKPFEELSSIFNNKNQNINFPEASNNGESINKNHVFLTSHECMVVPGCSKLPRETVASRLRFEKQHSHERCSSQAALLVTAGQSYHKACLSDGYQTPTQKKDVLIRDLKRQIREMKISCDDKDREISMYKQHVDEETSKLVQAKDDELTRVREELKQLKQSYDDISNFCEESITTASLLEQKAEELKLAMDNREKQHQIVYLEMYKKGQDSARFEREEELERLASAGGCNVTISELVRKLAWTEMELAKWQTLKRQESYESAFQPETEADATLKFLKDSLFHYITDDKDSDHHLRAMIRIFKYTDGQIEKIKESKLIQLMEKRNKSKSKRKN